MQSDVVSYHKKQTHQVTDRMIRIHEFNTNLECKKRCMNESVNIVIIKSTVQVSNNKGLLQIWTIILSRILLFLFFNQIITPVFLVKCKTGYWVYLFTNGIWFMIIVTSGSSHNTCYDFLS